MSEAKSRPNILIVDDTPANLRLLADLLQPNGYKVRPASSGEMALQSAALSPPDLILLDIRMPELDGFEVCRRLKAAHETRDIPVIFISAMSELQDRLHGLELGAVDYIPKPFEREEVLQRVRIHLELQRMRTSLEQMVRERTSQLFDTMRALQTLSGVNHALVHAQHEEGLLQEICHVIHETGGFPVVWIGYSASAADKLEPVAHAGADERFVEALAELTSQSIRMEEHFAAGSPAEIPDMLQHADYASLSERLTERGLRASITLPLHQDGEFFGAITLISGDPDPFSGDAATLLKELAEDLAFGIHMLRARKQQHQTEQDRLRQAEQRSEALKQTIQAISLTVEKRDPYTAGHQQRVAALAYAIGEDIGLSKERLEGLRLSALIHDLGKISIPAEILNRPGKLTDIEMKLIEPHSQVGYDIIKGIEFPWPIAEIILEHHERVDGSGYPRGLKGDQILLEARIIAVADVLEAMSSHRPYRPALGLEPALEELITHAGKRYDAQVVESCVTLFREKGMSLPEAQAIDGDHLSKLV